MVEDDKPADSLSSDDRVESEIEVHIAEYTALSEFQSAAKSSFVRLALYHNTGLVIVAGWVLSLLAGQNSDYSKYIFPVLLLLPVVNSVLIIACAYQIYSFYCVAGYFRSLRKRLKCLLRSDVLGYENKFAVSAGNNKKARLASISMDVIAAGMWLIIPVFLAAGFISTPLWLPFDSPKEYGAYALGSVFSLAALGYLFVVGWFIWMSDRDQDSQSPSKYP